MLGFREAISTAQCDEGAPSGLVIQRGGGAIARRTSPKMADHNDFANLIWQIADLLRGPIP